MHSYTSTLSMDQKLLGASENIGAPLGTATTNANAAKIVQPMNVPAPVDFLLEVDTRQVTI